MINKLKATVTGAMLALMCVGVGIGVGVVGLHGVQVAYAQSTKRLGADVAGDTFEHWLKRIGFTNTNGGCDVSMQYVALNTAQIDDCSQAGNLADLTLRGITLNGVPSTQGVANSDVVLTKPVTAIANNTATTVLTVSVPNAEEEATIPIVIHAALGAGGAVGAGECSATAYGQVVLTRTAAVATVATATTIADAGTACVAGATTMTLAYSVTSMTGATSATQTFNIQITVARGGGSSTNHKALVEASVLNIQGSGVTIS